jgi:hypothetical protein
MNDVEHMELEMAFAAVRTLVEYDGASRVTLEWKPGESPSVTFVPSASIEYVSANFTVVDEEPFVPIILQEGSPVDGETEGNHIDCPCWKTGTYKRVEGCRYHPYDL